MMTRSQAVEFLINEPYKFGHMLGFTDLKPIHNEWIKSMVRGKSDETLQASRQTYKTTCDSIALSLIIILLPLKHTLFMRKTDNDVKEIIKQVQNILRDPHTQYFVNCIYGVNLTLTTQSVTEVSTNLSNDIKGTSQLVGMGIGASLTGKHFDFIFTDDIININDRTSRAERERTKLVYQELHNIKNRGGKIFNTGTPWHPDDAFSIMPEPKKYDCYEMVKYGVLTDEDIAEIKKRMSPSFFSANYELRHIPDDNLLFEKPIIVDDTQLVEQGTTHVDSAFYGEDYTAMTICKVRDGKFYVFGKMWRKHVNDVMDEIIRWHEHFMCGKLYTEKNADKGYVASQFRNKGVRVVTYNEKENKHVKIVNHLKFNWQDVIFVAGTDESYLNQIADYTEDAEHDDAPDSLASIVRILEKKRSSSDADAYNLYL